jgi:hypothetical protein
VKSAYDSELDASFFLNPSRNEMIVVWQASKIITMMEGANFVDVSEGPNITSGDKTRAFFITAAGLIVQADLAESGSGTMWGLDSSYTLDGVVETASATKNHILDSDATFHEDMKGALVYMASGSNAGQSRKITGVTAGDLTVEAFEYTIAVGDRYSISPVPFKVRLWPLQIEGVISKFRRWVMKGMTIKTVGISGFIDTQPNEYWRVGAYRNGGQTLQDVMVHIPVYEVASDSAGVLPSSIDGIDIEPYIEQISTGTMFELTAAEVAVSVGTARGISHSDRYGAGYYGEGPYGT